MGYYISQSGELFNAKVFFTWIADSLLASFLVVMIPIHCYEYMTSPDHTGQSSGIWTVGIVTLTSIVFTANIRLLFVTNSWIWITHFFFWASIAAYFLSMILFRVMGTGRFWLTVLLTVIIALFAPFTYVSFTTLRTNAKLIESQHSTRSFNSIHSNIKKQKGNGGIDESSSSKEPLKANSY